MTGVDSGPRARIRGFGSAAVAVSIGPPGCGKTERQLRRLDDERARGTPLDRIGFMTFTRAARFEAARRVGESAGSMRWIRTVHGAAYSVLGLDRSKVMNDERWAEFGTRHAYEFTRLRVDEHDAIHEQPTITSDDELRFVHQWAKNTLSSIDDALRRCPVQVSRPQLQKFYDRVDRFQREHGLTDFPGMLIDVLERRLCPPIDVLFVDEAQDLSPLQAAVVEFWGQHCERVYVAGDDDQTIYGFQGADPSWIIGIANDYGAELLSQSHRVPVWAHGLAERIIRANKHRLQKEYRPTDRLGRLERLSPGDALALITPDLKTFVLARNRMHLGYYGAELLNRGVPFAVEGSGAHSPLSDVQLIAAVRCAVAIEHGETIAASELRELLRFVPGRSRLAPDGVKAQVEHAAKDGRRFNADGLVTAFGIAALVDCVRNRGPIDVLEKLPASDRVYLSRLIRHYGELPDPQIILTSIHGAKGRQANLVLVVSDMTARTHREFTSGGVSAVEAENRVFYVAVTRTLDTLVLVDPSSRRHFDFPKLRFEEGFA